MKVTLTVAIISVDRDGGEPNDPELRLLTSVDSIRITRDSFGEPIASFLDPDGRAIAWAKRLYGLKVENEESEEG